MYGSELGTIDTLALEANLAVVVLVKLLLVTDLGELGFLKEGEQVPGTLQRSEDVTFLVFALGEELVLELLEEEQVVLIIGSEGVLTNDGLHGEGVLTHRVEVVQLVRDGGVILTGQHLAVVVDTDRGLHETGQRRQHIDWWVDLAIVEVAVDEDLALSDVSGQIRDRVRDIIVGHSENGQLGNGTVGASDTTSSLINSGEIRVHVTWVATTAGHFLTSG